MDKRCQEAMFAVAVCIVLGPFTGWFAESYLNWHWLPAWLSAVAVSGFTVYLSCDIPGVKAALPKAWQYAVKSSPWSHSSSMRRRWKLFFWHLPRGVLGFNMLSLWVSLPLGIAIAYIPPISLVAKIGLILAVPVESSLIALAFGLSLLLKGKNCARSSKEMRGEWKRLIVEFSPVKVLCYRLPVGIYKLCRYLPVLFWGSVSATVLGVRFFGRLYVLIHTQLRVLALVDAALFAGVCYFTYDPVWASVAAVLGAGWFAINYVWIAPRVLKVHPA